MKPINNILIFTNTLEKGGAEVQALALSNVLQEQYKVYVVVFYGKQIHPELLASARRAHIELIFLSGNKLKNVFDLIGVIRKYHIDCIYSFLATTNVYAGIIGKLCRVPYLLGGIRSSRYKGMKMYVQRWVHNHCMTLSISNNYNGKDFLVKAGFQADKIQVIHNAFVPKDTSLTQSPHELPIIVSVGRFVPEKDYATALKAIHALRLQHPELSFRYRIIGYGPLENEVRQHIKALQLEDITEVLINPLNIDQYLFDSDIFLQTSLFEGTSNAILEAMYAQLPIVATKVGDNEYMVNAENGFLCEVKQSKDLAEKLGVLLQDTALRQRMGEKSREIVCNRFSVNAFKEKNLQLLERIQSNGTI